MTTHNYNYEGKFKWFYNSALLDTSDYYGKIRFSQSNDYTAERIIIYLNNVDTSDTFNITNNSKDFPLHVEINSALPIINFINNGKGISCQIKPQDSNEKYENVRYWNVSGLTDMSMMFINCITFNQPLNNWNVSNATNMSHMFFGCTSFNQPLNDWDVSNITDTHKIFHDCTKDRPKNQWET